MSVFRATAAIDALLSVSVINGGVIKKMRSHIAIAVNTHLR